MTNVSLRSDCRPSGSSSVVSGFSHPNNTHTHTRTHAHYTILNHNKHSPRNEMNMIPKTCSRPKKYVGNDVKRHSPHVVMVSDAADLRLAVQFEGGAALLSTAGQIESVPIGRMVSGRQRWYGFACWCVNDRELGP